MLPTCTQCVLRAPFTVKYKTKVLSFYYIHSMSCKLLVVILLFSIPFTNNGKESRINSEFTKKMINTIKETSNFTELVSYLDSLHENEMVTGYFESKNYDIIPGFREINYQLYIDKPIKNSDKFYHNYYLQVLRKANKIIYIGIGPDAQFSSFEKNTNIKEFAFFQKSYERIYGKQFDPDLIFYESREDWSRYESHYLGPEGSPSNKWQLVDYLVKTKNVYELSKFLSSNSAVKQLYGFRGLSILKKNGLNLDKSILMKMEVTQKKTGYMSVQRGCEGFKLPFEEVLKNPEVYDY